MNDEIKVILDYLKDEKWEYYPSDMIPYKVLVMEERDKLLDYITNLQEENERLKANIDWWKDRFFGQQEFDDSHRITAIEYKKRIDKVIEYIKNDWYSKNTVNIDNVVIGNWRIDLLNILQNGSDEE